jgi:hypothetical protein
MVKVFNQSFVKLARTRAEELIDGGDRGSVTRPALAEAIAAETDHDVATVRGALDACLAGGMLKGLTTRRGRKGGIVREVAEAETPAEAQQAETAEAAPEADESCADAIEAAAQDAEVDERPAEGCPSEPEATESTEATE